MNICKFSLSIYRSRTTDPPLPFPQGRSACKTRRQVKRTTLGARRMLRRGITLTTPGEKQFSGAGLRTGGGFRMLASANFGELVLAFMAADFCNHIVIVQHFSRSTILTFLCTGCERKSQQIFGKLFRIFSWIF